MSSYEERLKAVDNRLWTVEWKTRRDERIGHPKMLREFRGRPLQSEGKVGSCGNFREFLGIFGKSKGGYYGVPLVRGKAGKLEEKLGSLREVITRPLDLEGRLGN